jgi:hypothetical protein
MMPFVFLHIDFEGLLTKQPQFGRVYSGGTGHY